MPFILRLTSGHYITDGSSVFPSAVNGSPPRVFPSRGRPERRYKGTVTAVPRMWNEVTVPAVPKRLLPVEDKGYEVVMNFKEEGMSMQEKALKIIKKDGEISVQK